MTVSDAILTPENGGRAKRKRHSVSYYISSGSGSDSDGESESLGAVSIASIEKPLKKKKKKTTQSKHKSTRPVTKRKTFPFMSLPPELRNLIYSFVLVDSSGVRLMSRSRAFRRTVIRSTTNFDKEYHSSLAPSILLLNREIYKETQPILYGGNQMILDDTYTLHTFLATIGSKNCAALTNIKILAWGEGRGVHKAMNHAAFTLLAQATNLQRLNLSGRLHWRDGASEYATQLYRDGFHFFETFGSAKGRKDAAVDILQIGVFNERAAHPPYVTHASKGEDGDEKRKDDVRKALGRLLRRDLRASKA